MKLFFLILFFVVAISACNNNNEVIAERLAVADSAAINFYKGDGTMDTVVAVKIIHDKNQLQQLATFVSSGSTDDFKCGYDGSIHFFKANAVLQDIDFRMNEADCKHFSLLLNGKLYSTKLSDKAKLFLEALKR